MTNAGVGKSGSPAPRSMIGAPAARSALARADTAIVADSLRPAMFADGAKEDIDRFEGRTTANYTSRRLGNVTNAREPTPQTFEGGLVEAREAGVTRGQNAVYVMPHDWASIAQFLAPLLERVE